jgi:hypothetical protein
LVGLGGGDHDGSVVGDELVCDDVVGGVYEYE